MFSQCNKIHTLFVGPGLNDSIYIHIVHLPSFEQRLISIRHSSGATPVWRDINIKYEQVGFFSVSNNIGEFSDEFSDDFSTQNIMIKKN